MIPVQLRSIWKKLEEQLERGEVTPAANLLLTLALGAEENLRPMHAELRAAIEHPAMSSRRDELHAAFCAPDRQGRAYPLPGPGWTSEVVERGGKKTRYLRDEKGRINEVLRLDGHGKPALPHLLLDPDRQCGSIHFRSTADSFGGGRATAGTAYGDEVYEAKMTYASWRDSYLRWFREN